MSKLAKKISLTLLIVLSCFIMVGCDEELPCSIVITQNDYPSYDFESALIVYPCGIENMSGPLDATTITGGFGNTKEDMYWLADYLRNEGDLIVIVVSASNNNNIASYEKAHKAGVNILKDLNADPDYQLYGKIGDIGVIGYSMGGAGALQAANDQGAGIGGAIGLAPYQTENDNIGGISVPTMVLVGSIDAIAPPAMAYDTYGSLPNVPKLYGEIKGKEHLYWVNNNNESIASPYILAWLKYYLSGDDSYHFVLSNTSSELLDYEYIP